MISYVLKWGANYIVSPQPIEIQQRDIKCVNGNEIRIGDKITQIGTKKRSLFQVDEGYYIEYNGLITDENGTNHALFTSPFWPSELQGRYYLEFSCVMNSKGELWCFLQFNESGNASRDIDVNTIKVIL